MIIIDFCPNHKIQFVDKNLLNLLILYLIILMYLISFSDWLNIYIFMTVLISSCHDVKRFYNFQRISKKVSGFKR